MNRHLRTVEIMKTSNFNFYTVFCNILNIWICSKSRRIATSFNFVFVVLPVTIDWSNVELMDYCKKSEKWIQLIFTQHIIQYIATETSKFSQINDTGKPNESLLFRFHTLMW